MQQKEIRNEQKELDLLMTTGCKVLYEALGPVGYVRFISMIRDTYSFSQMKQDAQ